MIDKELLLKRRLNEREVEIPGVGTVRVRGLSRAEALACQKVGTSDVGALEQKILHLGLVDPRLTEVEVAEWYAAAPAGEIDPVTTAIQELSGLGEGAGKSDVPGVRS